MLLLADDLWKNATPIDWKNPKISSYQKNLDKYILEIIDNPIILDTLYQDVKNTCNSRTSSATNKKKTKKTKVNSDISSVADIISDNIKQKLESKLFPESFFTEQDEFFLLDFGSNNSLHIILNPFINKCHICIMNYDTGNILFEKKGFPNSIADIIIKSLFLGRKQFKVPKSESDAHRILKEFGPWFEDILKNIKEYCKKSAIGTRYEKELFDCSMKALKIHPDISKRDLKGDFFI